MPKSMNLVITTIIIRAGDSTSLISISLIGKKNHYWNKTHVAFAIQSKGSISKFWHSLWTIRHLIVGVANALPQRQRRAAHENSSQKLGSPSKAQEVQRIQIFKYLGCKLNVGRWVKPQSWGFTNLENDVNWHPNEALKDNIFGCAGWIFSSLLRPRGHIDLWNSDQ